ncbi:MAG: restriction endonuclease subunit S [Myxococcales bacterium]|nr:restriction endonuclease subunit S [Myxococcales bacterium]
MIAELKPYAEYKESGLPWLGRVPGHWASERAKWLFTKMDRPVRDEDEVVTCFRDGMVTLRKNRRLSGFTEATVFSGYQGIRKGDLVIHGMDAFAGSIGVSDSDGKGTPVYNVCQPKPGVEAWYYAHLIREMSQSQWILALAKGIRERSTDFRFEMFGNQRVPLPPPDEQTAIVRFLDWANGRLERAIRAKRKVIALLGEQKQAIIHRAVTRGLDPSVPLKPSGIPWLGDIPEHWETPLFGRLLTKVEQGWSPVAAEGELALDQWAVLTLSAVRRGVFNPYAIKPVSLSASIPTEIEVAEGDVLLTRSNTRDRVGDVCIVRKPRPKTILCDLIYRLRVRADAIVPEFLVYQMLSRVGRGQIERDARGSSGTMPKISQGHIKSWRILCPPAGEQRRIVNSIDVNCAPVNTTISRLEREIELLREYRTRLVADVVTGKLDVREAAKGLPEKGGLAGGLSDSSDLSDLSDKSDLSDLSDSSDESDLSDESDGADLLDDGETEDAP